MISLAKKLCSEDIFVRVDFYTVNNQLYFGELTYHPGSGNIDFYPDEYDYDIGRNAKTAQRIIKSFMAKSSSNDLFRA